MSNSRKVLIFNFKPLFFLSLFFFFNISFSQLAFSENIFQMRLVSDPKTMDWSIAATFMETPVLMNIMEGLTQYNDQMKIVPLLAKDWTISEDQKTYTFHLKENVFWSDGIAMSADDFIFSWKRLLEPLTGASYAYLLFDIEGAEDFYNRKTNDFSKVGIKKINANTIQVHLRKPLPYFLQIFSFWVTFPLRKDLLDKYGASWTQPGKIAVLGPFIPVQVNTGTEYIFKRNPKYHIKDTRKNLIDTVKMRVINEDSTALNLFKSGALDFVRPINFFEIGKLSSVNTFHQDTYYRTCFLSFNTTKYPFNLPQVRKAISQSLDRSKIEKLLSGSVHPTTTLVPRDMLSANTKISQEFSPEKAKKLLEEVGLTSSAFTDVELLSASSDENTLITQFIQDQLKTNLGIKISVRLPEYKTYRTLLELGSNHLYYRCWGADYADPDSYFAVFTSKSGNNRTNWKNTRYDELVSKASSIMNTAEREILYKEAMSLLLLKEVPIAPLLNDSLIYLLNPKFKNFHINPLNYFFLKNVTL